MRPYFDELWLLDIDFTLAEKRIVARHIQSGICKNETEAKQRWEDNDKPNGKLLLEKLNQNDLFFYLNSKTPHGIEIKHSKLKNTNQNSDTLTEKNPKL